MTISNHARRFRSALCVAILPLLSLALASCTSDVEPEEEMLDIEALQSALDEAHAAHDDQGDETLDDIATAAHRRIRAEVGRGTLSVEEARRLSRAISGMKARFEGAVESERLTIEAACARFREEIVRLFEELRKARERRSRGTR
ncbi:MAG: hypothetical protein OXU69_15710 [Gemmatimonadota bacterium]|nr:hypothetical protein [Gemmatimonadota bacterium]MDE2986148.1 hypothetical protein [Gemmatimonadota bacterium]